MVKDEDLLFYDIEVFRWDSLVVLKDINHNKIASFWNNRERAIAEEKGEKGFLDKYNSGFEGLHDVIQNKVLVGFNNYGYDDVILDKMQKGINCKTLFSHSNSIICGGRLKPSLKNKTLDTMQQISVSHPSLKQIEGNMGLSIIETSVPFDIDRPLTDEERAETEKYCEHDVDTTIEVYKLRKMSYFAPKESLINRLPESDQSTAHKLNTTTLSAKMLLGNEPLLKQTKITVPDNLWRNIEGIPEDVWTMWDTAKLNDDLKSYDVSSKDVSALGCSITFGFGGLHGAPEKPGTYYNVRLLDVGSMYPSLIRMLKALGKATDIYDGLRLERLKIKHTDKVLSDALKLVLNSVYGNFRNQYSQLHSPKASASVCIYGQIAVFELARELYNNGYEVININTDGVAFVGDGDVSEIVGWWETKYDGMVLEEAKFDKWIQKDVNNYIAVTPEEKIKVKGGEVNKYHENKYFDNNNCRIIQIAMVDYLVNGVDIVDTLYENIDKPELYQYVLKAGGTYQGVCDERGNMLNKVNRVFARQKKSRLPETKLYKVREDGGLVNFPDVPESMFLWNDDVRLLPDPERNIDLSHYHKIIKHKLEGWGV